VYVNHRIQGVAEQVEDDLLELNPIAGNVREVLLELHLNHDAIALTLAPR
jgi:hypothetical protein